MRMMCCGLVFSSFVVLRCFLVVSRLSRILHPSCQRGRRVTPKPSDGRRGVCAGLASRQELRQLLHAAKNQGDQLEILAVAWRQGNQADGQGTTRNLTQGRRADSGRDKRPEIQFDGNLCARFQVILWSDVSQHLRKSSAFSTQHGCLMAGGRSKQDEGTIWQNSMLGFGLPILNSKRSKSYGTMTAKPRPPRGAVGQPRTHQ